ncbi:hypothetical protein MKI84_12900 [Ancylobacter sp. A5.8]|uniref:hypothetical protein n=1 Tax=Ancylobacter gelatini TaxID=2919920 RepID=UPI001F4D7281|nr:hypothetical protein [Ancylobacter gelatini]MCJ8143815.1 hypothetical protein [Ancylobacter gelatini]
MLDPITIVQRAAMRIGEELPSSMADVVGEDSIELVFNDVVDFCLDLHPWDFTRELRSLSRLAGPEGGRVLGYPFAYQLPTDVIGEPLRVVQDHSEPDVPYFRWTMHGPYILAADEPLYAVFNVRPPPIRWPGAFRNAVVLAIAAELALSMASNESLRADLRRDAYGPPSDDFRGGAIGVAIRNQAFRTPAKKMSPGLDPFSSAWRG